MLKINGVEFINTSEAATILGLPIGSKQLKEAGIKPFGKTTTATLWRRSDMATAALNIADRLIALSDQITKELK